MTHDELLAVLDDAPPARVEVVYFAKPPAAPKVEEVVVLSQRATTSSRHPGKVFTGAVHATVRRGVCPKCGGQWRGGDGPHSPRWSTRDGQHVQVDCVGDVVAVPPGQ
ncbi:MAG: hypothetical protein ACOZQL_10530 [Myxococcota bacterium]